MKRRKKIPPGHEPGASLKRSKTHKSPQLGIVLLVLLACLFVWQHQQLAQVSSMLLLTTMNCSSVLPNCSCSWRGGKFVADCSVQNLTKVPKNDYYDFLFENSGNNQMPTLNRDIQALNLSSNQIVRLGRMEFLRKKFRNLQKIQLNSNGLQSIEPSAFYKLTGLIELDLSDNLLLSLQDSGLGSASHLGDLEDLEATTSNKTKIQNNQTAKSFLNQNLAQLRQLNLEANRLRRIEEFAFSLLTQLRQLYLSRNEIQFIDKRAFYGLNVLNILHLDGNKLSYLNGEILLRLPQLNALQLAQNKWRCDCRLRKLVRQLVQFGGGSSAPRVNAPLATTTQHHHHHHQQLTVILQDEPRCWRGRGGKTQSATSYESNRLGDSIVRPGNSEQALQEEEEVGQGASEQDNATMTSSPAMSIKQNLSAQLGGKTKRADDEEEEDDDDDVERHDHHQREALDAGPWTNMRLGDFECAPRLARDYLAQPIIQSHRTTDVDLGRAGQNQNGAGIDHAIGSSGAGISMRHRLATSTTTLEVQRVHLDRPIELTCPIELVDELDVELTRVEWLYSTAAAGPAPDKQKQRSRLIWRSNDNLNASNGGWTHNSATQSPNGQQDHKPRQIMMLAKTRMKPDSELTLSSPHLITSPPAGDKFVIIDYVTRANGAQEAKEEAVEEAGSSSSNSKSDLSPASDSEDKKSPLLRIVHLILDGPLEQASAPPSLMRHNQGDSAATHQNLLELEEQQLQPLSFLCRISNSAGQVDLWQPIEFTAAGNLTRRGHHEFGSQSAARLDQVEQLLHRARTSKHSKSPGGGLNWPLDRVESQLRQEFAKSHDQQQVDRSPLFVPIHLSPQHILVNAGGGQQQQQQQQQQRRPSNSRSPTLVSSDEQNPSHQTPQSLERSLNAADPTTARSQQSRPPTTLRQTQHKVNETSGNGVGAAANPQQSSGAESGSQRVSIIQTERLGSMNEISGGEPDDLATRQPASSPNGGFNHVDDAGGHSSSSSSSSSLMAISSDEASSASASNSAAEHDAPKDHNLRQAALSLIGRFTSQRPIKLLGMGQEEQEADAEAGRHRQELMSDRQRSQSVGLGQRMLEAWRQDLPMGARMGAIYGILKARYAGAIKTIVPANTAGPLLLVLLYILAGLVAGCLLTSVILLKMRCLQLSRRHSASSGSGSQKRDAAAKDHRRRKVADCQAVAAPKPISLNLVDADPTRLNDELDDYATEDQLHGDQFEGDDVKTPPRVGGGNEHYTQLDSINSLQQPPPPSGSSGSTSTTTMGSQRVLLPHASRMRYQQQYMTHDELDKQLRFSSLPREHQDRWHLGKSDFANYQLPRSSEQEERKSPNEGNYEHLMGPTSAALNKDFSPSRHSNTTTSEALSEFNQQRQMSRGMHMNTCTLGRKQLSSKPRTVTWLMSTDQNQYQATQLYGQVTNGGDHLEQRQKQRAVCDLHSWQTHSESDRLDSGSSLLTLTNGCDIYESARNGRRRLKFLQNGNNVPPNAQAPTNEICLVPANLCISSSGDESNSNHLLYSLDERHLQHLVSIGSNQGVDLPDQAAGSSSIASPNATVSTSSTSGTLATSGFPNSNNMRQRRQLDVFGACMNEQQQRWPEAPTSPRLRNLDDALLLLKTSMNQCDRAAYDEEDDGESVETHRL